MDDPQDDVITILKALANPTRLQILDWLKEPDQHFGAQPEPLDEVGVCVSQIQRKAGVSQSTASHFMSVLQHAGLVNSRRVGQWTYYQRNEPRIAEISPLLARSV